jgi:hypothetical protein
MACDVVVPPHHAFGLAVRHIDDHLNVLVPIVFDLGLDDYRAGRS